jgi:hypothetical protein
MPAQKRISRMQKQLEAAGFTEQDLAAVHRAFFEAVFEPGAAKKFTDDDVDFLSRLKISPK